MFEFKKDYVFAWPVKVLVPTEEDQVEQQFTGLFSVVPNDVLAQAIVADPTNADAVVVRQAMVGWKADLTEGGVPKPYSSEAREALIALPFVRYAIAKAYYDAVSGALRLKN